MNYKKFNLEQRLASRRFGKETHFTAIRGKQLIDFINRNSLFPPGFFVTHPNYGYSSIRNRVVAIPSYNVPELKHELDNIGFITPFNPTIHKLDTKENTNRIIDQIVSSETLAEFLRQTMALIYLINCDVTNHIDLLDSMDITIDTIDVAGTINGTLVPKSKIDNNEGRSFSDK